MKLVNNLLLQFTFWYTEDYNYTFSIDLVINRKSMITIKKNHPYQKCGFIQQVSEMNFSLCNLGLDTQSYHISLPGHSKLPHLFGTSAYMRIQKVPTNLRSPCVRLNLFPNVEHCLCTGGIY